MLPMRRTQRGAHNRNGAGVFSASTLTIRSGTMAGEATAVRATGAQGKAVLNESETDRTAREDRERAEREKTPRAQSEKDTPTLAKIAHEFPNPTDPHVKAIIKIGAADIVSFLNTQDDG